MCCVIELSYDDVNKLMRDRKTIGFDYIIGIVNFNGVEIHWNNIIQVESVQSIFTPRLHPPITLLQPIVSYDELEEY